VKTEGLRAVIFDMDGVLVDREPLHERAFLDVFAEQGFAASYGVHFPDYYGRSDRAVWVDFIARHNAGRELPELLAAKRARFAELLEKEEPIFDGLSGLLGTQITEISLCPL